jgi:hypothetical protein
MGKLRQGSEGTDREVRTSFKNAADTINANIEYAAAAKQGKKYGYWCKKDAVSRSNGFSLDCGASNPPIMGL